MSIQIIDGFQVNAATPIDNRIVASGSVARNAIPYKYEGLRVFDTFDSIPYVWLNNNWVSENASGILGSGSASRIPLYTSSNIVGNSLFYQSGNIISTVDAGSGADRISMNAETGLLTAINLSGNGSAVTGILGSNINNNSISVSGSGSKIIPSGTIDQVLVSGVSFTNWRNLSDVSVGTASISSQVRVTGTDLANANRPITFIDTVNITPINNTVKANTFLTYNPATRTLVTGTASLNGIKFPSTQVPSTDVNTLDDYEEGTWTPTISGVTSGFTYTSSGFYTKVGKVVFVGGYIKYTSLTPTSVSGSENNNISITNIPYQSGVPLSSASVGQWSKNLSTGTIENKFFNTSSPYNMDNGPVVVSYQASNNANIYFSSTSGQNPLSGGPQNQVISFSLTFIPN
jgi:hypothetical protein